MYPPSISAFHLFVHCTIPRSWLIDDAHWCCSVHELYKCSLSPSVQFSSVAQSCPTLCDHGLQHAMLPCPSLSSGVCSNSCLVSWWCHPTIPSSVVPFSSCIQSFPASGSFLMSRLFTSGVISWIAEFHKYGSKFSFALAELLIPSEVNALKKNQIKNSS